MYSYKLFNNIAQEGQDVLANSNYISDDLNPDAIILRSFQLNKKELNENLKCIARAGAGTNNIPVEEATEKGIVVFNTPGANSNAVKELVLCGMLLASRGIIQGNAFAKSLKGKNSQDLNSLMEKQKKEFKGNELRGKVLGIIGLGSVGSLLAQTASVLGMKIIGYDPYISVDAAWMLPKEVEKAEELNHLLSNSDYISLHIPLTDKTKNYISKKNLNAFKPGSKLINLSRGGIVNNEDILEALQQRKVSNFVTDFPTKELIERSVTEKDVILLPHLGASTKEAEINCAVMASEQVKKFLSDGVIINSINFPKVSLGRTTKYRMVIIHKDEPGVIGMLAGEVAAEGINIPDMINKSRNEIAITLIDLEKEPSKNIISNIKNMETVLSIRVC